jgi:plasmid stabilization system protein ParE
VIRELEERWGSRWCPGNTFKVQFCWRKVIWDAIRVRTARGKTEEEAVAELEQLYAGRSLNQLVDELRQCRQRPQEGPGRRRGGRGRPVAWQAARDGAVVAS